MGQNAPHYKLDKLPPLREKKTVGIVESQKVGRETLYINKELIDILKQ